MIPLATIRKKKKSGVTISTGALTAYSPLNDFYVTAAYKADEGVFLNGSPAVDGGLFDEVKDIGSNGYHALQTAPERRGMFTASDSRAGGLPSIGQHAPDGIKGVVTPVITSSRCYMVVGYGEGTEQVASNYLRILGGSTNFVSFTLNSNASTIQSTGVSPAASVNGKVESATLLPLPLSLITIDYEEITQAWNIGFGADGRTLAGPIYAVIFSNGEESEEEVLNAELWLVQQAGIEADYNPGGGASTTGTYPNSVYNGNGGDVAALTTVAIIAKQSEAAGQPVTFGLPFKQGDFPSGSTLTAKIGGVNLPIQIDRKAEYSTDAATQFTRRDLAAVGTRSVLHAIVSANIPASQVADDVTVIDLYVGAGSDLTTVTPIAFPSRTLEIEVIENATTFTASLSGLSLDAALGAFGSGAVTDWLSGPTCREWQIRRPFNDGTSDHAKLTAVVGVRHYATGQTRFDVAVENTVPVVSGSSLEYDVRVKVDGTLRYTRDALQHFQYARWRMVVWDTAREMPHVDYDPAYLSATKMFPNYEPSNHRALHQTKFRDKYSEIWFYGAPDDSSTLLTDSESTVTFSYVDGTLAKAADSDDPDRFDVTISRFGPMGIGTMIKSMGTTGNWPWIGPLPAWSAGWIVDQQYAPYRLMLKYGDLSGSWSIHYRDQSTGNAISIQDNPTAERPVSQANSETNLNPYKPDKAHQPSHGFAPYLITGDVYYLEEMHAWSAYNALRMDPAQRNNGEGLFERSSQLRGWAWALRNLGQASAATPDSHPLKGYFMHMLDKNIADHTLNYITNPGPVYGAVTTSQNPITSPWMDDYLTWATSYVYELGFTDIFEFAKWKGNFPVMRLGYGGEWCYQLANAYHVLIEPDDSIPLSLGAGIATIDVTVARFSTEPIVRTMFASLSDSYDMSNRFTNGDLAVPSNGGNFTASYACGTQALADELGVSLGEIDGKSNFEAGYTSQMSCAISAAVNLGTEGAGVAYATYDARPVQADYSFNPSWGLVPRT